MMLSPEETQRYTRHLSLKEIGIEGQEKLKKARVICMGAGGLGCPALLYLTAAGIGHIGIVDGDIVELSNLQRQTLFTVDDIGKNKAVVAKNRLQQLNPHVKFEIYHKNIDNNNILNTIQPYDIVIDATDHFPARYLISDACSELKKPNIHASIMQFEGVCTAFTINDTSPCYRCLFPEPPAENLIPNCAEAGVLGVLPGILGTLQAVETIKLILHIGEPLAGKIIRYDALKTRFRTLNFSKNNHCIACGENKLSFEKLLTYQRKCNMNVKIISPKALQQLMQEKKHFTLLDVREDFERDICHIQNDIHIPLKELENKAETLSRKQNIIVYCKLGGRSAKATQWLNEHGFDQAMSLDGGIIKWINEIDPSLARY